MALFQVPGWSVPAEPAETSRKRKRSTRPDGDEVRSEVNLDRLVKRLKRNDDDSSTKPEKRKNISGKEKKIRRKGKGKDRSRGNGSTTNHSEGTKDSIISGPLPLQKMKKKDGGVVVDDSPRSLSKGRLLDEISSGLTSLQNGMKQSLDGARFRWINEKLYNTDSAEAHKLIMNDSRVFEEYHTGFRRQVHSWPSNPVSHYISSLSLCHRGTVIADFGCGDAALARALIPKGMAVLSFDLVSDGVFVIEADICKKLPLPGSEGLGLTGEKEDGEGNIVDVVVCSLSLMGTNWPQCIREAWRVLKTGGDLKIAEVASRITDVDEFVALVNSVGFRIISKDDSNTHFTLFEFKKIARRTRSEKEWDKINSRSLVLKPCEYKRR